MLCGSKKERPVNCLTGFVIPACPELACGELVEPVEGAIPDFIRRSFSEGGLTLADYHRPNELCFCVHKSLRVQSFRDSLSTGFSVITGFKALSKGG